ncbi:FadR/GntR family transcriptional regulator [Shimia sp.]|uniref:FadR/GntR family transcriptional regulator n=1 Tax=Shimia sp. TaxID=1954381 RepID=UPI0032997ACB
MIDPTNQEEADQVLNAVFTPIDHTSVVDSIVSQIETLILNGILRDGGRLPSERDLAEQMGVSRPKVREALKLLEENDLILARHGEGTFVAPLVGSAMSPALIALYARHQDAFNSYLEFRIEQESFAANLAATRATKADKEILTRVMEDLEAAHLADDSQASQDADIRFHSAIIDASHNSLLVHTMSSIYALTRQNLFYNRSFLRSIDGTGQQLLAQHREIFEAIKAGNPERAATAARDHIEFVQRSYVEEQSRAQRDQVASQRLALL